MTAIEPVKLYMTDLEKQLPEGREKDDILFALRPAWEQLVEENK